MIDICLIVRIFVPGGHVSCYAPAGFDGSRGLPLPIVWFPQTTPLPSTRTRKQTHANMPHTTKLGLSIADVLVMTVSNYQLISSKLSATIITRGHGVGGALRVRELRNVARRISLSHYRDPINILVAIEQVTLHTCHSDLPHIQRKARETRSNNCEHAQSLLIDHNILVERGGIHFC